MTDRELLQQALQHLVDLADDLRRIPNDIAQTIAALETELAKPEQTEWRKGFDAGYETAIEQAEFKEIKQAEEQAPKMPTKIFGPNLEQILNAAGFYKHEWVGLTDEEINDFDKKLRDNGDYCSLHFAWGISAKLKEKNNGSV